MTAAQPRKSPSEALDRRVRQLARAKNNFLGELKAAAIDVGIIDGLTDTERVNALQWACRENLGIARESTTQQWAKINEGLEDGRRLANRPAEEPVRPRPVSGTTLDIRPASSFKLRALEWFWQDRFPLGKFCLIGGLPDKGKGLLTCFLCACATGQIPFPVNEGQAPRGNVILLSGEDDPEDTLAPRLAAAGADLDKVHIVRMAREKDGRDRVFNMLTDLEALRAAVDAVSNVVLVIIDPISAYVGVGKVNSAQASDVRGFLQPFCDLAAEKNFLFLGVMHLNKKADVGNALLRFSDSIAYPALSRSAYLVADDPEIEAQRVVARVKGNLGPDKKALTFRIGKRVVGTDPKTAQEIWAPHLEWGHKYAEVTANEAMQAESGGTKGRSERREAKSFLQDHLAAGPVAQKDLVAEAEAAGIAKATLTRAKQDLGVKSTKAKGLDTGWVWEMPG